VRRVLSNGYVLDDSRDRIDVAAVHDFLSNESYWARGRSLETQARLVRESARVVGLYRYDAQIGFARVVSDGISVAYLADVYVLSEARGKGLGLELVGETINYEPLAHVSWLLHTEDAHRLYARLGFQAPGPRTMERPAQIRPR
jgi:GNAT superfamily N-acetyltransferase